MEKEEGNEQSHKGLTVDDQSDSITSAIIEYDKEKNKLYIRDLEVFTDQNEIREDLDEEKKSKVWGNYYFTINTINEISQNTIVGGLWSDAKDDQDCKEWLVAHHCPHLETINKCEFKDHVERLKNGSTDYYWYGECQVSQHLAVCKAKYVHQTNEEFADFNRKHLNGRPQ